MGHPPPSQFAIAARKISPNCEVTDLLNPSNEFNNNNVTV